MKSSQEVAKAIASIFHQEFGGKTDGKFRITRQDVAKLFHVKVLRDSIIAELYDDLVNCQNMVMFDIGDYFVVEQLNKKYDVLRLAPQRIIDELC